MISNYLRVITRDALKGKTFTLINVFGLSVSLAASLIMVLYLSFEFSFDDFHAQANMIYRLQMNTTSDAVYTESAATYPVVRNMIDDTFTDIAAVVRIKSKKGIVVAHEDTARPVRFSEDKILYVDEDFLSVFTFPLLAGNEASALSNPNSVVITASIARKYFGDDINYDDLPGKTIRKLGSSENELLTITGVCEDAPSNTHLDFDFLISYQTIYGWHDDDGDDYRTLSEQSMEWGGFYTYILTHRHLNAEGARRLEQQVTSAFAKQVPATSNDRHTFTLQPVESIHLESHLAEEYSANGDKQNVYLVMFVSILLLSMALINYVNLSSTRASGRTKEVGIRKALGAGTKQIMFRFGMESLLFTLISAMVSIVMLTACWSFVTEYLDITIPHTFWSQRAFIIFLAACLVGGTVIQSLYPITMLSHISPKVALHGGALRIKGEAFRNSLVVIQFAAATLLIAGSITAYRQLNFMMSADIGIRTSDVLILKAPKVPVDRQQYLSRAEAFKSELQTVSGVANVTTGVRIPGEEMAVQTIRLADDESRAFKVSIVGVDQDYLRTLELEPVAGRQFTNMPDQNRALAEFNERRVNLGSDDHSIIINELASTALGFRDPADAIGQQVFLFGAKKEIIGVVPNFRQQSAKVALRPTVFYVQLVFSNYYIVGLDNAINVARTLPAIEKEWTKFYAHDPFEYFFLEDFYNRQYQGDIQFERVFTAITMLTLIIASLGLFALSLFVVSKRAKEIAIRKIAGASTTVIVKHLLRDFMKLVIIATLISLPFSYVIFSQWLNTFSSRISLGAWFFWIPFTIVSTLSMSIVFYQVVRGATSNPVTVLRRE